MSNQINEIKRAFLLLAQLPHCENKNDTIINLINGLVVGIEYETEGKLFGPKTRSANALTISYNPPYVSGYNQTFTIGLDANGATKLLLAWTAQAKSLGLPVNESAQTAID